MISGIRDNTVHQHYHYYICPKETQPYPPPRSCLTFFCMSIFICCLLFFCIPKLKTLDGLSGPQQQLILEMVSHQSLFAIFELLFWVWLWLLLLSSCLMQPQTRLAEHPACLSPTLSCQCQLLLTMLPLPCCIFFLSESDRID